MIRYRNTLLIICFFTFLAIGQVHAQREFINARSLQLLTQSEIDVLDPYEVGLNGAEKVDWKNLKEFYKSPLDYIGKNDPPVFEPEVLTKIRALKKAKIQVPGGPAPLAGAPDPIFATEDTPADLLSSPDLVSNTIYALGQLLLERAKEELYTTHFQQVKAAFDSTRTFGSSPHKVTFKLADVLPNIYAVIADFDQLVQPQLGQTLQKAFELDLKEFHDNMVTHLIPDGVKDKWPFIMLNLAFDTIKQLNEGKHPSGIIKDLAWQFRDYNTAGSLQDKDRIAIGINVLNMISESLLSEPPTPKVPAGGAPGGIVNNQGGTTHWINSKTFKQLSINGYKYYFGLLYLNHQTLFEALNIDVTTITNTGRVVYEKFQMLVEETLAQIEWIEGNIRNLKASVDQIIKQGKASAKEGIEKVLDYTKSVAALLKNIRPTLCAFVNDAGYCDPKLDVLFDQIQVAMTIPADIKNKEYAEAFLKSYNTGKMIYEHYATNTDFAPKSNLIRYLTLANDIVQADSIEQIKTILDAAIMPVGSYREKRSLKYTTTINAYVGITAGKELILTGDLADKWGTHLGPFAPVGLDFSWATKNKRSNGIFISIIDIGAVVNMYFAGDDTIEVPDEMGMANEEEVEVKTLPEISFKSILAPGLYYTNGFKNSPLSFGLGAQLAPDLRRVSIVDGAELATESSIRFSIFLGLDIPLFSLARGGRR